jgi:acetyl-CoA carboxylase biotin carboxyl carrier protein
MAKKSKPESSGRSDIRGVDLVEVERLLAFMQKHGLEEFEYEHPGIHIRLRKMSALPSGAIRGVSAADIGAPVEAHAAVPAAAPAGAPSRAPGAVPRSDIHLIKSPIVGTFYAAPSPGADPFVTRGARVDPGQVLCIIEAMKLMNEIESDVAGEVVEVFVENGSPVEYGQPLFGIRPQGKK